MRQNFNCLQVLLYVYYRTYQHLLWRLAIGVLIPHCLLCQQFPIPYFLAIEVPVSRICLIFLAWMNAMVGIETHTLFWTNGGTSVVPNCTQSNGLLFLACYAWQFAFNTCACLRSSKGKTPSHCTSLLVFFTRALEHVIKWSLFPQLSDYNVTWYTSHGSWGCVVHLVVEGILLLS